MRESEVYTEDYKRSFSLVWENEVPWSVSKFFTQAFTKSSAKYKGRGDIADA